MPVSQWKTAAHTILPTVTSTILMATLTRVMRASMLEVTMQDYIKTARAKGLGEGRITGAIKLEMP